MHSGSAVLVFTSRPRTISSSSAASAAFFLLDLKLNDVLPFEPPSPIPFEPPSPIPFEPPSPIPSPACVCARCLKAVKGTA